MSRSAGMIRPAQITKITDRSGRSRVANTSDTIAAQ